MPKPNDQRGKHKNHRRGRSHPRWNQERIRSEHGYVKVRVGRSHPLADPNGYAYEHLLVWVSAGNQRPGRSEVLHHLNDDKTDNRIENLQLISRAEHNRLHNKERGRNPLGQFNKRKTCRRQTSV